MRHGDSHGNFIEDHGVYTRAQAIADAAPRPRCDASDSFRRVRAGAAHYPFTQGLGAPGKVR